MILDRIEWKKEYMWLIQINLSWSHGYVADTSILGLRRRCCRVTRTCVKMRYCGDNFSYESNLQGNLGIYAVIYLSKREFRSTCSHIHNTQFINIGLNSIIIK